MNDSSYAALPPPPSKKHPVRALLQTAGLNVSAWAFTKDGQELVNANNNIGRNTSWSYIGGDNEPVALCLWFEDIDWTSSPPIYAGNDAAYQQRLIDLAGIKKGENGLGRLSAKLRRSRMLYKAVYEAHAHERNIRVLLVAGDPVAIDDSAEKASIVKARELDPVTWYVHNLDGNSGRYTLIRGVKRVKAVVDPYAHLTDPGLDPAFLAFIKTLTETEREAVIKARVGQGPFRDALIARWGGCSVTGCGMKEALVASHIKPWSQCTTAAERLGSSNGLLLVPNLDKLFDRGLISFEDNLKIVFSPMLKEGFARQLNVDQSMTLRRRDCDDLLPFMAWHRDNVLIKATLSKD